MARKNPAAVALGRLGGKVTSQRKKKAAQRNAKLGGRAKKFGVGDRVTANDKAPGDYRDRSGKVFEVGPGRSEYGVKFDRQTDAPDQGYMMSWWIDAEK